MISGEAPAAPNGAVPPIAVPWSRLFRPDDSLGRKRRDRFELLRIRNDASSAAGRGEMLL
jgi:hypothetical protein